MEVTKEQLIAIATDKRIMEILKIMTACITDIEATEFRLECNNKHIANGQPASFEGITQEVLDAKKKRFAETPWNIICRCTHKE